MLTARSSLVGLILLALALPTRAGDEAEKEKPEPLPPELRASQVSLIRDRKGKRAMFRASVIGKADGSLTLLTAAHCLGAADEGGTVLIRQGESSADAVVESVKCNPFYRPAPSGDIPGADNAVVRLRLDTSTPLLKGMQPVAINSAPAFDASGRTLAVGMIDQFGKSHVVRAGNYDNPRWLEWGPTYMPVPGDSGSGVFILRVASDRRPYPVLVGVVVDRSQRGGGASLASLKDQWLVNAALPPDPKK